MQLNNRYRKLYKRYLQNQAKRRRITLWLDRKSERHIQIMAIMFFIGFFLTLVYGYKTLASWSQISQIYFGLAVIFNFIPSKWLPFIYRIRKELKVILAIFALSPFFTGIVLLLNFYISTDKMNQTINIAEYNQLYYDEYVIVKLDDDEMNKHIEIRKFSLDKYNFEPDSACYLIHTGVFGIKSIHDSWLIP